MPSPQDNEIAKISREFNILEQEIVDLNANLDQALDSIDNIEKEFTNLKISENIYADLSIDESTATKNLLTKAAYNRTITSTLNPKNIFGVTIVTLKGVGMLQTNGSTSKPIDAYGSYTCTLLGLIF